METDDSDNFECSDTEIDAKKHEKLVDEVLNLDKVQNLKKPSRTEPTLQISEYNLVKSITGNKGSVHVNELTKVLKDRKKHGEIERKLKSVGKAKTLPKPLEKPQADRIRRTVAYEKTRLDLDKWEGIVTSNRALTNLSFPLNSSSSLKIDEKNAENYTKTWRLKSELQQELDKLSKPKVEEYHIDTDKEKFVLTAEEMAEQRKEAAKLRAHQSFKEAKARRQNKIKSKKYHRILRRTKIKQQLKEFEELQKTNPEEALKKLEEIEKARAEERFSLRHRGTGQWAKTKQIRAKYDKESRQVLAQQLAISRDLTTKLKSTASDSEDEGIETEEKSSTVQNDESNPWVANGVKPDKDVLDFVSGYRKFWNEHNKNLHDPEQKDSTCTEVIQDEVENINDEIFNPVAECEQKAVSEEFGEDNGVGGVKRTATKQKKTKNSKKVKMDLINSQSTSDWEVSLISADRGEAIEDMFDRLEDTLGHKLSQKFNSIKKKVASSGKKARTKTKKSKQAGRSKKKIDLTLPSKSKKHVIDEELLEEPARRNVQDGKDAEEEQPLNINLQNLANILEVATEENKKSDIDPNKFMSVKTTNLNTAIPDILSVDDVEMDDNDQRDVIMEAFEDDDIVQDFNKDKSNEINSDKPKDIDLNLPGWGCWGGTNIKPDKRKRKRFITKMPPKMPRKDDNKGSLIINEKAQKKIKPLLVSEVPFPFKTVKDFEASIRASIGNTFVPETAFNKLIQPAITTKTGAIIEPMSKDVLMNKKKT